MKLFLLHGLAQKMFKEGAGTLRKGQCYMNTLAIMNKALYDEITGTDNDPFYVDEKLPQFLELVAKEWDEN